MNNLFDTRHCSVSHPLESANHDPCPFARLLMEQNKGEYNKDPVLNY